MESAQRKTAMITNKSEAKQKEEIWRKLRCLPQEK